MAVEAAVDAFRRGKTHYVFDGLAMCPGVRFASGNPLTSADVKWSLVAHGPFRDHPVPGAVSLGALRVVHLDLGEMHEPRPAGWRPPSSPPGKRWCRERQFNLKGNAGFFLNGVQSVETPDHAASAGRVVRLPIQPPQRHVRDVVGSRLLTARET